MNASREGAQRVLYFASCVALLVSLAMATPWGVVHSAYLVLPAMGAGSTLAVTLVTPLLIAAALFVGTRTAGAPSWPSMAILALSAAWLCITIYGAFG